MSIATIHGGYYLICDNCGEFDSTEHLSLDDARKSASERWKLRRGEDGYRDRVCPECAL